MNILEEYLIVDKVLDVPMKDSKGREFMLGSYKTSHNGVVVEHGLIYKGNIINQKKPIYFRINSACYTSDIFDCQRCDCHWQLKKAINFLHKNNGLIIYHFHHEGRGFGFTSKLRSLKTESPIDSIIEMHSEIDHRRYYSTIKILQDLQISKVYLMTNNPAKQLILESQNIKVVKRIPLITKQKHLQEYLKTKQDRLGNIINKHDHKNH